MSNLAAAVWVELLKARRSKVPLFTALALAMVPFAGGFFMIIMKNPELARRMGMISAKAQIVGGAADWPTYFALLAQAVAIGGILVFSIITSWVFGRECSDRTLKDLLALPTPRTSIVAAKFLVIALWAVLLALLIYGLGLLVGVVVGLPPAPATVIGQGTVILAGTTVLTVFLVTPIAFAAGVGRGYLAPMGAAIFFVVLAQIVAAAGWGEFFPWAIPALHAGMVGPEDAQLGTISYILVAFTSVSGLAATLWWWEKADHTQ
jgi:ABC-2 type transport system permease protein